MSNPEEQGRAIDHTAERAGGGVNGILMLLLALALLALSAYVVVQGAGPGGKGYVGHLYQSGGWSHSYGHLRPEAQGGQ